MADKRTHYPIPVNTWVQVMTAANAATIYKETSSSDYISMIFDDAVSDPNTIAVLPLVPDTNQKIFTDGLIEEVTDSVPIYYWIACTGEKAGSVIVTN